MKFKLGDKVRLKPEIEQIHQWGICTVGGKYYEQGYRGTGGLGVITQKGKPDGLDSQNFILVSSTKLPSWF